MNGILLIDKPAGWTSMDVCAKLRGALRVRRVGHSGTLDPMATGLLVVFLGRATRAVQYAENHRKTYITYEYPDAFEEGKIPYYTVNDERNAKLAEAYKALAAKNPKLILAGRLATYRYLDMDDALVEAFRLFETLE